MKSFILVTFLTIILWGCSLSENEGYTNELSSYDAIYFRRIDSQSTVNFEERDYDIVYIVPEENVIELIPDHKPDYNLEDQIEEFELKSFTLDNNIFYIKWDEDEFIFTPTSSSVYELDNGTRYQAFAVRDGQTLDENPFYEED